MTQSTKPTPLRVSTAALPVRERLAFFREEFSRQALRVDVETIGDQPFHAELSTFAMEDVRLLHYRSSPLRFERTRSLLSPDEDSIGLVIVLEGTATLSQHRREVEIGTGDAVVISHHDPARLIRSTGQHCGMIASSARLAPMVGDIEAAYGRRIPRDDQALRLLTRYLGGLRDGMAEASPELQHAVATHLLDLAAVAIGANRDGGEFATARGMRAARLRAVRSDILVNLANPRLSVASVAARQGITPRYLHMLFEPTGTSFSQFVLHERLASARRMLADPRRDRMTITAVAWAAGFSDLSYFNRAFRARYGMTPREIRRNRAGRT